MCKGGYRRFSRYAFFYGWVRVGYRRFSRCVFFYGWVRGGGGTGGGAVDRLHCRPPGTITGRWSDPMPKFLTKSSLWNETLPSLDWFSKLLLSRKTESKLPIILN